MSAPVGGAVDVVVVGAGLSGLTAARTLAAAGHSVRLLDKGRSVGGRLATRRVGDARLDHGAQFFTVRGERFAALVEEGVAAGVIAEWCRGFGPEPDGHPRYACPGGMNALAKWLAEGLDVVCDAKVAAVRRSDSGWRLDLEAGSAVATSGAGAVDAGPTGIDAGIDATAVLMTSPAPQTLAILDAGGVVLDPTLAADLAAIEWFPTLAVLATLDTDPAVPEPGGVQLDDGPFTFVADNARKGISAAPAITLHAAHDLSRDRWDDDPEAVLADLLDAARLWLGSAGVVEAQLKKWRYAGPVTPLPVSHVLVDVDGAPLAMAGDAFGGPKVEGAASSGLAAGDALVAALAGPRPH